MLGESSLNAINASVRITCCDGHDLVRGLAQGHRKCSEVESNVLHECFNF